MKSHSQQPHAPERGMARLLPHVEALRMNPEPETVEGAVNENVPSNFLEHDPWRGKSVALGEIKFFNHMEDAA
jgi:hypothetical protein